VLRVEQGLVTRLWLSTYTPDGSAGTPTSLPAVTIDSARRNATILTDAPSSYAQAGLYYFDLSPSTPTDAGATELLDELTLTWEYALSGADQVVQEQVLVVGQRLASTRAIDDILNRGGTATDYEARTVAAALQYAEDAFEEACDRAFSTRWATVTLDGTGTLDLFAPHYPIQSVLTATVDGLSVTVQDLEVYDTGRIYNPSGWASGRRNVTLTYEYGSVAVPAPASRAVALIATSALADGPWDDRGFGVSTDGGFVRLLTAGVSGAAFSIPEVQAAVHAYRRTPLLTVGTV